jgi:hypothetical protein
MPTRKQNPGGAERGGGSSMVEKAKKGQTQIQIRADESVQAGVYANVARISNDADAFVLDFVVVHASPPFGRLVSRVVMSPANAKRLAQALTSNLEAFETAHGPIALPAPTQPGPEGVQ